MVTVSSFMADTITIPSPSVFLTSPLIEHASPPKAQTPARRRAPSSTTTSKHNPQAPFPAHGSKDGVIKQKQSKSRNGCVTCKAKRLKCDETKPTCQQCSRRNVECGGYKKDYKWRTFAEINYCEAKPPGGAGKKSPPQKKPKTKQLTSSSNGSTPEIAGGSPIGSSTGNGVQPSFPVRESPEQELNMSPGNGMTTFMDFCSFGSASTPLMSPLGTPRSPLDGILSTSVGSVLPTPIRTSPLSTGLAHTPPYLEFSPTMSDFSPTISSAALFTPNTEQMDDSEVEGVIRTGYAALAEPWTPPMSVLCSPKVSPSFNSLSFDMDSFPIYRQLTPLTDSPEQLCLRFDRQTCGILSMKDGPTENPWRTLIWPLAHESSALYHAIASMTSFHTSKNQPQLRVHGIDHMRSSVEELARGIADMNYDTAIATTLALAFAESWDQHISTGINHIKGAKILVSQAIAWHKQTPFSGYKLERLKFLTNAWVYMDVIARLTSMDKDESEDFDAVYSQLYNLYGHHSPTASVDPLMGAAASLFPVIGRVANLVRRVRRETCNSPAMISRAMQLKAALENWEPPTLSEVPQDPTTNVQHSLQTAEAYRWATLLYLHQAVPEIPSESSAELAKRVMCFLATVPLSSRTVIVHIYPLIAAGCEAQGAEDRGWVRGRWEAMAARMKIGVIDRCLEVVKEVWNRRDAYEARGRAEGSPVPVKRAFSFDEEDFDRKVVMGLDGDEWAVAEEGYEGRKRRVLGVEEEDEYGFPRVVKISRKRKTSRDAITGDLDVEFTVKGSLHWLGVMKDWNWEVLLG
ncbi:hypothetical protein EJ06DRAFT_503689 [Trichodelitschia bisporula]|uniref:Zn(2)-C6 fungal-type domain-containing protein n=1 Tax=Trichodelitschia bisporula TaxID=703511 RepID=A0A6G1I8M1_9PEZI|nr:hypothetical protein EJ06DRAFT_503689 [Trichodelitschia bisporula]